MMQVLYFPAAGDVVLTKAERDLLAASCGCAGACSLIDNTSASSPITFADPMNPGNGTFFLQNFYFQRSSGGDTISRQAISIRC